jgi:predicted RND superfamily exporter protein
LVIARFRPDFASTLWFLGGIGAIIEWILVFLILPCILTKSLDAKDFLRIKANPATPSPFPKWPVVRLVRVASVVFFILFAIGTARIQVQETPDKNFKPSHEYSQTIQYLQETRHWKGHFYLQFESLKIGDEVLKQIRALPNVTAAVDPRDILEYTLHEVPPALKPLLEEGIIGAKAFKEFNVHEKAALPVFVKEIDTESLQRLFTSVKEICGAQCKSVGELVIYSDFANIILKSLYESMGASLALIFAIIFLLSGHLNWRERAAVCFSVLLCPVGLLGIIGWGGFEMNLTFSIVGGIFVGIAGDNAIQFIISNKDKSLIESIEEKRGGSGAMSLMGGIISSVLVLNSYQPLSKMAWLLVFGFILLYLGDVYVLQMWLRRK